MERTKWLEKQGFKVVRFWNRDVLNALPLVKEVIWNGLGIHHPHPSPDP